MGRCTRGLLLLFVGALVLCLSLPERIVLAGIVGEQATPILLSVQDAPIPFRGSDGRTHLVYEIWLTNFSSADAKIERVEVLGDGAMLEDLQAAEIGTRLQPAGTRSSSGTLKSGVRGLLFLHVTLAPGAKVPSKLTHRVTVRASAAPPGREEITTEGAETEPDRREVAHLAPPLRGERYLSADSCCDATRHTRAALPVNGRVWIAQRFAVDWEQMDAEGRIYSGAREKLESYPIFGKPALAVADATVESTTDRYGEQTPGVDPVNMTLEQADGNSVVLDLGQHRYALYAHLQPGSIRVKRGDKVKTGQVLALVGNTGNSFAPHLHFHVMDGPSPLASNGLPYEINAFEVTGKTPGTEAFDRAEADGTPLTMTAAERPNATREAMPLDQLVISFLP